MTSASESLRSAATLGSAGRCSCLAVSLPSLSYLILLSLMSFLLILSASAMDNIQGRPGPYTARCSLRRACFRCPNPAACRRRRF